MSIKVQDWVADRKFNSSTDKNILMAMASHASDCGSGVWASHQSLADRAGVSRETAVRSIKRLLAVNLIKKTGKRVTGSVWTHEYSVCLDVLHSMPFTATAQAVHDRFKKREVTERHNEEVTLTQGGSDADAVREVTERHTNRPITLGTNNKNNSARGTFLSNEWTPPEGLGDLYRQHGHTQASLKVELEKFRDYWAGVSGAKGRKRSWDATWRNWIRNSRPKNSLANTERQNHERQERNSNKPKTTAEKLAESDATRRRASSITLARRSERRKLERERSDG